MHQGRALGRGRRFLGLWCALLGLPLAALLLANAYSLVEGLRYAWQALTWHPQTVQPLSMDGPFGSVYALVELDNAGRHAAIESHLEELGLAPIAISVADHPLPNVLVMFGRQGPCTLFVAHYDKSRETPAYQGASDNTAAVAVLLAAAADLRAQPPARCTGLLFTAAEEQGFLGARAFLAWAATQELEIHEAINLDMLGRGRLGARPSALPGFCFWLPGMGELVFDGTRLHRGEPYAPPDRALLRRLRQAADGELIAYRRFTAHSDSNVFQAAGIPAVSLSSDNMYYLNLVWERDADRVELLDERHLELARDVVVRYALLHTR
jgi:hypothetical protein